MQDSGKRDTFSTGCVRDNGEKKPRPDLISPFSKLRLGDWLRKGAEKYDERNWEKGMSISRCMEAIERHVAKYQIGMRDEDHMSAIMCNAMFIIHYEEMIKIGVLPESLDDMPRYIPMPLPFRELTENSMETTDEDALMKELDEAYQMELDRQNANPTDNPYGAVSKVTGKAIPKVTTVVGGFPLLLPDNNHVDKKRIHGCDICNCEQNINYYRYDLDRHYCSLCYYNNRIDLKPVIHWR